MTKPNSFIWLCNIPELPNDYSHTYDFVTPLEQKDFFNNKMQLIFTEIQYIRKDQSVKVPIGYDAIKDRVNYAVFSNGDQPLDNKLYFAFIDDIEYINENTSKLYLQLDVIQTYMFDFDLKPSYVDRMHVDRWNRDGSIAREIEPEDLEFGDHIQTDRELLHQYEDQYIMVSKNPLGYITEKAGPGGLTWFPDTSGHVTPKPLPPIGGTQPPTPVPPPPTPGGGGKPPVPPPKPEPDGTCWQQKIPSRQLFRFIKGFEGFAQFEYKDSGGVRTIGYGTTAGDKGFSQMIGKQPVSEADASHYAWQSLISGQYTNPVYEKMKKWGLTKQCQFDALVSFTYNAGEKWLDESNTLPSYIQNHQWDKVRKRWPEYIVYDDAGQKQPGLVARRTEEMHMFFGETYEVRKIPNVNKYGNTTGTYVSGDGWIPAVGQDGTCDQGSYGGNPGTVPDPGTGKPPAVKPIDADAWQLRNLLLTAPCTGSVTATFPSYSSGKFHSGFDIGAQKGDLIYAPCDLYIEMSADLSLKENDPSGSFGRYVKAVMYTDDGQDTGLKCWFAHMSSRWVETGQRVKRGQILGQVGSTGNSTGPHCHFEVRESPWQYGGTAQTTDAINPKPGAHVGDWIRGPKPIKWQGKTKSKESDDNGQSNS